MNKRGQNAEIPAWNMKDARLHSIDSEQWALSFLLHPCFCSRLILFLRSRLVVLIVLAEPKNRTLSVLSARYSDGTPGRSVFIYIDRLETDNNIHTSVWIRLGTGPERQKETKKRQILEGLGPLRA